MYYCCFVIVGGAHTPAARERHTRPSDVYLKVLEDFSYQHEEAAFRFLSGRFNRQQYPSYIPT